MNTTLNARETSILDTIRRNGRATISLLQAHVSYGGALVPQASIRRAIQSLRRKGYDIVATVPNSRNSRYELRNVTTASEAGEGVADVASV